MGAPTSSRSRSLLRVRLLTVVGNRPQFIKAWPFSQAAREAGLDETVLHTGQHYDRELSQLFFDELELAKPAYDLDAGGGTSAEQLAGMLPGIEAAIEEVEPAWVVVFGDTNSTLAGALAASSAKRPVAHVEAGMRSRDLSMPEEYNRILTDRLSRALFCPSSLAVENLAREGIRGGVYEVGDVMRDVARLAAPIAQERSTELTDRQLNAGGYLLLTVHRQANAAPEPLEQVAAATRELTDPVIFPMHPRTRAVIEEHDIDFGPQVERVDPVGLVDFTALLMSARAVLTDSGGIQKEAYWHGVPCITLRDTTEWPETVDAGWNHLVGTDPAAITKAVETAGPGPERKDLYGDGHAAEAIVRLLGTIGSR